MAQRKRSEEEMALFLLHTEGNDRFSHVFTVSFKIFENGTVCCGGAEVEGAFAEGREVLLGWDLFYVLQIEPGETRNYVFEVAVEVVGESLSSIEFGVCVFDRGELDDSKDVIVVFAVVDSLYDLLAS